MTWILHDLFGGYIATPAGAAVASLRFIAGGKTHDDAMDSVPPSRRAA